MKLMFLFYIIICGNKVTFIYIHMSYYNVILIYLDITEMQCIERIERIERIDNQVLATMNECTCTEERSVGKRRRINNYAIIFKYFFVIN